MAFRRAWRSVAQSFKAGYEHIGLLMLCNVTWFVVGFLPVLLVTLLQLQHPAFVVAGLIGTLVTFGPATAGVHNVIYKLTQREDTSMADFKEGFLKFFGRSLLLTVIMGLVLVILIVDLGFSLFHPTTWIQLLSGIWIYFIIFWGVIAQFVFPFLIQQESGILTVLKRSSLLAMDNILISLLIALASLIVWIASILLAAPLLLFVMGLTAFIQHFAFADLMQKYDKGQEM